MSLNTGKYSVILSTYGKSTKKPMWLLFEYRWVNINLCTCVGVFTPTHSAQLPVSGTDRPTDKLDYIQFHLEFWISASFIQSRRKQILYFISKTLIRKILRQTKLNKANAKKTESVNCCWNTNKIFFDLLPFFAKTTTIKDDELLANRQMCYPSDGPTWKLTEIQL